MLGLKGTAGILFFPFPSCYYLFPLLNLFSLLPQKAFLACPREKGQLQLTRGQCDSCLSPQDMLKGSPIFSARKVTLPALISLWAANHERARRERKQGEIIWFWQAQWRELTQLARAVFLPVCRSQQFHQAMRTAGGCLYRAVFRKESKCCVSWLVVKCGYWWVSCSRVIVWPVAHMDQHRPRLICSHISGRPVGFPSCRHYFHSVHTVESSDILPIMSEEGMCWAGFAGWFVCLWHWTLSWWD